MKWKINPFTGLPDLTGDGSGGGGDGIQTINGRKPDANKNFNIIAEDVPDASESAKGGLPIATSAEAIAGTIDNKIITPKKLSDALGNALSGLKFGGLKYKKFDDFTQMEPNTLYISIDPAVNPPAEAKLPPRGTGKEGDLIIVYNIAGSVSFKVTLNTDLILHHDGQAISDIDGKYLLGDKGGSCVLLGCGGNQQWFSLLHYQITLTAGG